MSNIIVLGIAGGSGSGKTTLMKNLIARFQDDVTVLSHDNYYRPYDELTIEERRKLNYDHPDAFDTDMMIGHLKELKAGHSIECPRLRLCDLFPHERNRYGRAAQGHSGRGYPDLREPRPVRSDGYQDLCGYGRRRPPYPPHPPRRCKARAKPRFRAWPVSCNGQAHARAVR